MSEKKTTKKAEVLTIKEAKRVAKQILKLHKEIVSLRSGVLACIRTNVKEKILSDPKMIDKSEKSIDLGWTVRKVKRGYFGTDVRSEELLGIVTELEEFLKKNG